MLQAALQPTMGGNPAKFEDKCKAREHQVEFSVVPREARKKLRDNLLVNSKQFESNYNTLRTSMQAYLSSNKSANDFRSGTKESDSMEVDHDGK